MINSKKLLQISYLLASVILFFFSLAKTAFSVSLSNVEPQIINSHNHANTNNISRLSWSSYTRNRLPILNTSPITHLPVLEDGSSAMPSNANNFHGKMSASVDARTGSATYTTLVASMLFDQGQGRRELTLSYESGASAKGPNSLNLGSHWGFNIGLEHPSVSEVAGHKTTDIITSDGHSFTMVNEKNSKGLMSWHPLRHKLDDVTITGEPGNWTIATASGVRQHIQFGYEDWEEGRDGQRVWFYYDRNGPIDTSRRLIYICGHPLTTAQLISDKDSCPDNGIHITYQGDAIVVHGHQNITLHMMDVEGQPMVQSISMPSLNSKNEGLTQQDNKIGFIYDQQGGKPWLLKKIIYPTGSKSEFLYNTEASHTLQPQGLPTGYNGAHLPVVTEMITSSSPANSYTIPAKHIWYQYSSSANDQHNFTGYLSGVNSEPGKDNLFDRADNYTYTVKKDNGLTTTTIRYNKYHLPLSMIQTDDHYHTRISSNYIDYLPWKGTTFAQLPSVYSFPKKTTKTLYSLTETGNDKTIIPAKVLQQKRYNNNGQMIWRKDAYGRQIFIQYCPLQGDAHCPKMDPNWPQVTLPEKIMRLPAKQTPDESRPFLIFASDDDNKGYAKEVEFNYKLLPVSEQNKKRLMLYRKLLQEQWNRIKQIQTQTQNHNTYLLNFYSRNHFINDVGEDTSPFAGNWQVAMKSVGTLPASLVSTLQPGQTLPELTQSQLLTTTCYKYNLQHNSPVYGQLTQATVTKYQQPDPVINGKLFRMNKVQLLKSNNYHSESITLNLKHKIDLTSHTQTVTVSVAPSSHSSDITGIQSLLNHSSYDTGNNLSLGISTYSLTSGVKLSNDDTLKTLHSQWVYDNWQRPIKKTVTPMAGGQSKSISWAYVVTGNEQSVIETLPSGIQQKVIYADSGQNQKLISTSHRFKKMSGQPVTGTAGWIPDSLMRYTATGQLASKTVYHAADNNGSTIALTTTYGYDALNRLTWKKTPDGIISMSVINDPQLLLIHYQVATDDNQGEKLAPILNVIKSNTIGMPLSHYSFSFDPEAKTDGKFIYSEQMKSMLKALKEKLKPVKKLKSSSGYGLLPLEGRDGLFSFINAAIASKSWLSKGATQYDGDGRRISQIQPSGAKTHWKWKNGDLIATITPQGSIIHDTFDVQGNKIARCIQPSDQPLCHVLGTRGYDSKGNLQWQADEYGNKIHYTYDADGRLLSMTTPPEKGSPKGHVFTYTYNSFAKTSEALDGVVFVTKHWDPKTWQLTDTEDNISHLHYDYDPNTGLVIKITRTSPFKLKSPAGIKYPPGTLMISYDRYGHVISHSDFSGNKYTETHNKLGLVLQLWVNLFNQKKPTLLSTTTYDKYFNRPVSITNGIGVERTIHYDDLGQLADTVDKQGSTLLQQLSYSYNPKTNNIRSFTRSEGKNSATQSYTYDKKTNNLTSMHCGTTGQPDKVSTLCPRDTDLSGSSLTAPPIIINQEYSFDDWNNIKTVNEQLITSTGKRISKVTHYTYASGSGDNYDPHRMVAFNTLWQSTVSNFSSIPKTISYDTLGRVIKDAEGNTIHYNAFGQQDEFTNAQTGEHSKYTYDSGGRQIAEQPFNAKNYPLQQPLYMVYQGNNITEQMQKDMHGKFHTSVELADIAHSEDGNIKRWYLHDYKGDVITTLDNLGNRISDHVYSPYGMDDDLLSKSSQILPLKLTLSLQNSWWKIHHRGFDNQMNDPATGYQFLGGGYRAYNPVYRHFMSHDSYSPFRKINGYGFGDNNPIMNIDPTGHRELLIAYMKGILGIAASIASAIILPVAAAGLAVSVTIAAAITSIAVTPINIIAGTLQIAKTAHPDKQLSLASEALNLVGGLSDIGIGSDLLLVGLANVVQSTARVVGGFVAYSGLANFSTGATSVASSGLDMAEISNANLSHRAGIVLATDTFKLFSMIFTIPSLIGSIGAGITTAAHIGMAGNFSRTLPAQASEGFASLLNESTRDRNDIPELTEFSEETGPYKPYTRAVVGCGRESVNNSCAHADESGVLTFSSNRTRRPHLLGSFEPYAETGNLDGQFEVLSFEYTLTTQREFRAAFRTLKAGGVMYFKNNMAGNQYDFRNLSKELGFSVENITRNRSVSSTYRQTVKQIGKHRFFSSLSEQNWKVTRL